MDFAGKQYGDSLNAVLAIIEFEATQGNEVKHNGKKPN